VVVRGAGKRDGVEGGASAGTPAGGKAGRNDRRLPSCIKAHGKYSKSRRHAIWGLAVEGEERFFMIIGPSGAEIQCQRRNGKPEIEE
jgi:hypothetical protein